MDVTGILPVRMLHDPEDLEVLAEFGGVSHKLVLRIGAALQGVLKCCLSFMANKSRHYSLAS